MESLLDKAKEAKTMLKRIKLKQSRKGCQSRTVNEAIRNFKRLHHRKVQVKMRSKNSASRRKKQLKKVICVS